MERDHQVTVLYADRFGSPAKHEVKEGFEFIPVRFTLPKILHFPVLSKLIRNLGFSEKIRFSQDSRLITRNLIDLHQKKKFDAIESPNNGSCFHKLNFALINACVRIATTDSEHSCINKTESNPYLKELFKAEGHTFIKCPNLVTHTKAHRDFICNKYGVAPSKFNIIPLSVRIPEASEIFEKTNDSETIVLFVGRFEKRKGIDILMSIIPRILKDKPNTQFRLVGPDHEDTFKKNFRQNNRELINKVQFLGEKRGTELETEYRHCDIFIAPSRYESFGLIYAEAMSFSKPVIGTNVGGIPEVIENDKSGFLCENENPDDFADKLLLLINNKQLRLKMGRAGRERASLLFDFDHLVTKTEEYYSKLGNAT